MGTEMSEHPAFDVDREMSARDTPSNLMPCESSVSNTSAEPLLRIPTLEASPDEWASAIPLSDFPPMPSRGTGYCVEPICGIVLVGTITVMLVSITTSLAVSSVKDQATAYVLCAFIWTWAVLAVSSLFFILYAGAGEIKRSPSTSYPIPEIVAQRLLEKKSIADLGNIQMGEGLTRNSYCIRCLVWRRTTLTSGESHHCNTCQRCVTGFDHHCGVFGRCIVDANMKCFVTLIAMFFFGLVTAGVALIGSANHDGKNSPDMYNFQGTAVVSATNPSWGTPAPFSYGTASRSPTLLL